MIITEKNRYLAVPVFLFQMVFSCTALAHLETAKLFPSDGNAEDRFGVSVAIDGNTAVVGAYQNDSNGSDCGAAYVYELSGSQWLQRQKLTPSDGSAGDQFGRSVAIEGNSIVVGSYYDNSSGSAYVFTCLGGTWAQQQKLVAPDAAPDDRFGCCVAIDNNTIIVGAPNWVALIGAAYFYQRQSTTWLEQTVLRGDTGHFGVSVALDGNEAFIGAYENDVGITPRAGAAYVFDKTNANWVERQKLFDVNDPCGGDDFGFAVAIKNGTILVGCLYDFVDGNKKGSVFEFARTDTNWVQIDRLTAGDANIDEQIRLLARVIGSSYRRWRHSQRQ